MRIIQITFFSISILISNLLHADIYIQSPSCSKPYKPYKFTSEYEVNKYYQDVETYKNCIIKFVNRQRSEAANHQKAASKAIDEWNRFVKYEMK